MKDLDETTKGEIRRGMVHCWDPLAHKMVCGVRQQIGSTKHVRDVTCSACLGILGRPSRPTMSLVPA